jgi:hypothetical protein
MVELLAEAKARLLAERQSVTSADFEREWSAAWDVMTAERAWPHATEHRRQWRVAMLATKSETRAAFLDRPTTFGSLAQSLTAASARLHIALAPEDLPHVLIGAIQAGYSIAGESTVQEDPREGVLM